LDTVYLAPSTDPDPDEISESEEEEDEQWTISSFLNF
jgi:hypothetical protein